MSELSQLSGVDVGKLGQVLRFLATKHVYREGMSHLQFLRCQQAELPC